MPLQHHIAPGWILLQEDDGSVYLLEDIRNLPEAGGEEAKHSPKSLTCRAAPAPAAMAREG